MILYLNFVTLFFLCNREVYASKEAYESINCKNENEQNVDWLLAYHLPEGYDNHQGFAYTYSTKKDNWKTSTQNIFTQNTIVTSPFAKIYKNSVNYQYVMYNDHSPSPDMHYINPKTYHLKNFDQRDKIGLDKFFFSTSKGALIWHPNSQTAIWFIHSVPYFLRPVDWSNFKHQVSVQDQKSAHIFMCLQINYQDVEKVLKHLIISNVLIYDYSAGKNSLENFLNETIHNKLSTNENRFEKLSTSNGKKYAIINNYYRNSHVESPNQWLELKKKLKEPLLIKSFPNTIRYHIDKNFFNVLSLRYKSYINWDANEDQTEWAICRDTDCFCIGDGLPMNPVKTNAVCFFDFGLKILISKLISDYKSLVNDHRRY